MAGRLALVSVAQMRIFEPRLRRGPASRRTSTTSSSSAIGRVWIPSYRWRVYSRCVPPRKPPEHALQPSSSCEDAGRSVDEHGNVTADEYSAGGVRANTVEPVRTERRRIVAQKCPFRGAA